MEWAIFKIILFADFILFAGNLQAQNVNIDYQAWNPANPNCNVFGSGTDVPATINGNAGTIQHQTDIGQPKYSTADKSVQLDCDYNNGIPTEGTKYSISYNFKKGYRYMITVTAAEEFSVVAQYAPYLRLDLTNSGGSGTTFCIGNQSITQNLSGNPAPKQITSLSFLNYSYPFSSLLPTAYSSLEVSAIPSNYGGANTIQIRKITIVETPPPFTIAPGSANIICGSTAVHTFTVINDGGIPNVTNYQWNLGASNCWLYNGNPAPSTINTTGNTLTLTPQCGSPLHNITATVAAGGQNYSANTAFVTIEAPSLSISGSDEICSGSQTYTLSGVPCGAVVSWSVSPSGIANISSNGNQVTATKASNGDITLKATVNSCSSYTVQKDITVGVPDPTNIIMWNSANSITTVGIPVNFVAGYPPADRCDIQSTDWDVFYMNASIYTGSFPCLSNNGTNKTIVFQSTGTAYVRARLQNACGWSSWSVARQIQVNNGYLYKISPNPAQNIIIIGSNNSPEKATSMKYHTTPPLGIRVIKQVKIYDVNGKLVKQQQFSGNSSQVQMDVFSLSPGIYFIQISNEGHEETHKLVIGKHHRGKE